MEKQLEALNIDDSFESDHESSHTRINRTFSFPSSPIHPSKNLKELKPPKLDRHYSEQILSSNINTRRPTILSEMQARIKKIKYVFHDNSKDPEHFSHPRIDPSKVPSHMSADNKVEYMEVETYLDLTKYDTASSTSASMLINDQAEAMKADKYVNPVNPAECMDLSDSKEPSFTAVTTQAQTNMSRSVLNLEFPSVETNEDIAKLIPTRRKLRKTTQKDNPDYTDENDEDEKKQEDYQDTKKEIDSTNATNVNIKQIFYMSVATMSLIFVLLLYVPLPDNQNSKHSNIFATAVVELEKEIFGQDRAVEILTKYLQQDSPLLKVIALVGGTGVGKSYTVEIIRKNFHKRNNNYFFFSYADLFILENLKEEHLSDAINFVRTQEIHNDRYGTILAVFNVEQMSDNLSRSIDLNKSVNMIRSTFADANIDIKIIPYEPLSENALEKCIISMAKNVKLTLSQDQIALIKRQLIENNTGCKGAYGKVQVIGRQ